MTGPEIIYAKVAEAGLNAEWAAEIMMALDKAGFVIVDKRNLNPDPGGYTAAAIAAHAEQFMIDTEDR